MTTDYIFAIHDIMANSEYLQGRKIGFGLIFGTLLIYAPSAEANAGIPVIVLGFPYVLLNLLLVVGIEVGVLHLMLPRTLRLPRLMAQVFIANLITTLVGYPVSARLMALLQSVTGLNLGSFVPLDRQDMTIYIAMSLILTFIPTYFLSVWVENWYLRKRLRDVTILRRCVFVANLASYGVLSAEAFILKPLSLLRFILGNSVS